VFIGTYKRALLDGNPKPSLKSIKFTFFYRALFIDNQKGTSPFVQISNVYKVHLMIGRAEHTFFGLFLFLYKHDRHDFNYESQKIFSEPGIFDEPYGSHYFTGGCAGIYNEQA
jgi:hypothetical protein